MTLPIPVTGVISVPRPLLLVKYRRSQRAILTLRQRYYIYIWVDKDIDMAQVDNTTRQLFIRKDMAGSY
jgi:hypothetical protein